MRVFLFVFLACIHLPSTGFADRYDLKSRKVRSKAQKAKPAPYQAPEPRRTTAADKGLTTYGGCITETSVRGASGGQRQNFVLAGKMFGIGRDAVTRGRSTTSLSPAELRANQQLWDQILLAVELRRQVLVKVRGSRAQVVIFQWGKGCQRIIQASKPVVDTEPLGVIPSLDFSVVVPTGENFETSFGAFAGVGIPRGESSLITVRLGLLNFMPKPLDLDGPNASDVTEGDSLSIWLLMVGMRYTTSKFYFAAELGPSVGRDFVDTSEPESLDSVSQDFGSSLALRAVAGVDFGLFRLSGALLVPNLELASELLSFTLNAGVDFE